MELKMTPLILKVPKLIFIPSIDFRYIPCPTFIHSFYNLDVVANYTTPIFAYLKEEPICERFAYLIPQP